MTAINIIIKIISLILNSIHFYFLLYLPSEQLYALIQSTYMYSRHKAAKKEIPCFLHLAVLVLPSPERDSVPLKYWHRLYLHKHNYRPQPSQISSHTVIIVVDIITIIVDVAVVIDIRGIIRIVARRAQPPPSTLSLISILVASRPCQQKAYNLC